ncbi:MAG: DUF58 domain-containing protein [Candidatus Kapabacteria bacterium]|nr:DUF58 domain-containing protein [Candidatus Kapabacteria bacterium]
MQQTLTSLRPDVVAGLSSMELRARLVVEGFITGMHRSPFHGFSAEFKEHRQYRHGDELKHIDWRIYGRSDRFYVKQFEDETNVRCVIAVDTSASMAYASPGNISKFQYATYLAASLSYLLLHQRDAVGLALYSETLDTYLPPRSKMSYAHELMRTLEHVTPSRTTGTAAAVHALAERLGRRGLVVLISDLFDDADAILHALRHFRHEGHEVLVFHIMDPREVDFNLGNAAVLRDMETGQEITTQPVLLQRSYAEAVDAFCQRMKRGCYDQNIDYTRITTDRPFDEALREYIVKRRSAKL